MGDFNGDGVLDLVVVNSPNADRIGTVSTLLGRGDGTFEAPVTYPVGTDPSYVLVGDFNGDGIPDLAMSSGGYQLEILLGNGDGTFQAGISTPFRGYAMIAEGDFNPQSLCNDRENPL